MTQPNLYLPNLVQVRPQYLDNDNNKTHENVLWVEQGVNPTNPFATWAAALQSVFDADWAALWEHLGSSSAHYTSCFVTDWSSSSGATLAPNVSISLAGSAAASTLPSQVSALLQGKIATRYKGGHPRVYLPCIGAYAASVDGPSVAQINTAATDLVTFLSALQAISAANGGPYTWGVYRYKRTPGKNAFVQFTTTGLTTPYATQRRRIRKAPHH